MADEAPTSAPETARGAVRRTEPTKAQRAAARRVAESKATIPHLYVDAEIRATTADPAPFVHAVALALREFPRLNGAYRDGGFEEYSRINVGVSVPGPETLMTPSVFDADGKSVAAIAAELDDLARRALAEELRSPELAGGTFTIVCAGSGAIRGVAPVINGAQAATLALGPATERPLVRGETVAAGMALTATLACDARMVGADEGGAFLGRVRELVEAPEERGAA